MKKNIILSILICAGVLLGISSCGTKQEVFEAPRSGVTFTIPDQFQSTKGFIEYTDCGDDYTDFQGIVEVEALYYPMNKEAFEALYEEEAAAISNHDVNALIDILAKMNDKVVFQIYGINEGRGIDELIEYFLSKLEPEYTEEILGYTLTEEEKEVRKEKILSARYTEIGTCEGFTYILETPDPGLLKDKEPFKGYEDGYYEEYLSLIEDPSLISNHIQLIGGVELQQPFKPAEQGTKIEFETTDLDGNPVKSEDLFKEHKVTMINLWGTWCIPCKKELPQLEEINREFAEKNCQIIGIVTDADNEDIISEAKEILADNNITFINIVPFDGMEELLPQDEWPTSYFVDENGIIVADPVYGTLIDEYRSTIDQLCETLNK